MRTESHIWVCACAQVLAGRMQEERDFGHRLRGEAPCIPAQPRAAGANPSPVSSAADAESQDPDSTNNVESEAPRDYFLKCKWTPGLSLCPHQALQRLLGWALLHKGLDSLLPLPPHSFWGELGQLTGCSPGGLSHAGHEGGGWGAVLREVVIWRRGYPTCPQP